MLSKEELIQILGGMDESNLVKALGAVGVKVDNGQGSYKDDVMQDEPGESDDLTSWNATGVVVPESQRPKLFDKSQTVEKAQAQVPGQSPMAQQRDYARPDVTSADIAPFAANA